MKMTAIRILPRAQVGEEGQGEALQVLDVAALAHLHPLEVEEEQHQHLEEPRNGSIILEGL